MIQFALPDLLPKADAVLAVGTRMVSFANQPIVVGPGRPLVRIDADPAQLNRTSPSTLGDRGRREAGAGRAGRADRPAQPQAARRAATSWPRSGAR